MVRCCLQRMHAWKALVRHPDRTLEMLKVNLIAAQGQHLGSG